MTFKLMTYDITVLAAVRAVKAHAYDATEWKERWDALFSSNNGPGRG